MNLLTDAPSAPDAAELTDPATMSPDELARWDHLYTIRYCFDGKLDPVQDAHWRAINDRLLFAGCPETPAQQAVKALIARDARRDTTI